MENLKIYKNADWSIRTLNINGEPYFVGKDVAEMLGYSNTRDALAKRVDNDDKLDGVAICDSIGRKQKSVLINESGLYSLIFSSKLPTAKQFKKWVTSEVLPSIRKYGAYAVDDILNNPDTFIEVLQNLKAEREKSKRLTATVTQQEKQIKTLKPKASYYDIVLSCEDLIPISVIAKDYGKSGRWLNNFLKEEKIQYHQGNNTQGLWLLYQKYADCGYTGTKTILCKDKYGGHHPRVYTYWTQRGRLFIYDLLKSKGIHPLMEN